MRYPLDEAVSDKKLLKTAWDDLTWPQRTVLKAFYAQKLSARVVNTETGFSELDYWSIIQGSCEYDELGYVKRAIPLPYKPHKEEYSQLWAVVGRRAGKTSQLMSFICAYEALLGGHEEYVLSGQDCVIYLIAHRLDLAKSSLQLVRAMIDSSPMLAKEVVSHTADALKMKNGINIVPSSPSIKAQRGFAIPVAAMDEVGFWYSDPDAANPDIEVERAVSYSQIQFPFAKRVGISTPWTKEGLLWKYHRAGTEGRLLHPSVNKSEYRNILVCFGTTASFENPRITGDRLASIKSADEEAFQRESLCQFLDSISGFLSSKLVDIACQKARMIAERPPVVAMGNQPQPVYVAAMDPAFRYDSFAFVILHKEPGRGVVVDMLRRWSPIRGQKLNPKEVLGEICELVRPYGIETLHSDQYQLESLQQIALDMGLNIEGMDFTGNSKAKIFGSLQQLINQQKFELLDIDLNDVAKETVGELVTLEKRLTGRGTVMISAPEGKHDDMACALAIGVSKAMWLDPVVQIQREVYTEPTLFERGMATIRGNHLIDSGEDY